VLSYFCCSGRQDVYEGTERDLSSPFMSSPTTEGAVCVSRMPD
jgi:hypothetical protein